MGTKSRLAEAFSESFNVVGLAGAAALSLATLNPLPLLVGAVAEAAYLLFVPDSKWYDARLSRRFDAEVRARRRRLKDEVFAQVAPSIQERFTRLERIREQMDSQSVASESWFREVCRKLDYLLEKYLLFAQKDFEFRAYLRLVYEEVVGADPPVHAMPVRDRRKSRPQYDLAEDAPPVGDRWVNATVLAIQSRFDDDISRISRDREREEDLNTQAILDKRLDVLAQRRDYIERLGKIVANLGHQMELLEDSFGLISDQVRARSPEQVLADIEGVVYQTDAMTKLLDELAPYEAISARLAA